MARVQISDEVWAAYRAGLGATPVSVALGELVRREVGRNARRSASDFQGVRVALEDARRLSDELASLTARLERVASAPIRSADLDPLSQRERPKWADHLR
jgi:hypothetical protein